ncbi:hypothetical protein WJX82_009043 [Trebouxia sp. C0006]
MGKGHSSTTAGWCTVSAALAIHTKIKRHFQGGVTSCSRATSVTCLNARGLAGAGLNRRRDRRTSNNADQGGSTMQYQIHESHQQASPAYLLPDVARTAKAVAQAGASRASVGNQQTPTTRGSEHAPNNDATADATYMILLTISMAVVLARVAASPPPVSIGTALLERETRSRLRAVLQAGSGFALFVNGILNATQQDAQATARSLEQMLQQVCGQAVDVELVYNPTFATGNEFWIHIKEGVRALWQRKPVLLLLPALRQTFWRNLKNGGKGPPFKQVWGVHVSGVVEEHLNGRRYEGAI